ncbi:MAG: hypothetical protein GDA49_13870 [Rhodospirillales bacterium]|nr:hypothetical protein [Rhodospirillales bacterium]
MLLFENHENFIGAEVAGILDAVGHASVGALYDFGNSMNLAEEPMEVARAIAPMSDRPISRTMPWCAITKMAR